MRIVLAPDKFKGSLSAAQVAAELAAGLRQTQPQSDISIVAIADGGDGTLDAALSVGFDRVEIIAAGPTGVPRSTAYARRDDVAVIELAAICGLTLIAGTPDPLGATSFGLGTAVGAALEAGMRQIVVGIGGSASTDGGAGLLAALGVRLRAHDGSQIGLGGGALAALHRVEFDHRHSGLAEAALVVAVDVDNPLTGPNGAAAVYGPQKGATPEQVVELDANLAHFAQVISRARDTDRARLTNLPGAGAGGGVGFGALVLGAQLRSGIDLMLELVDFESALVGADLVITGEGSLDDQTLAGKAPAGVATAARRLGVPVVAVVGRCTLSPQQLRTAGISRVYPLSDLEPDLARSQANAQALVRRIGAGIGADLEAQCTR